jgi:hypothetical protein
MGILRGLWDNDGAAGIPEYVIMLATMLMLVMGTLLLIGHKSNHVLSEVDSSLPNSGHFHTR